MAKQAVWSGSPAAGAPYTPAIVSGNLVFVSGQIPLDPATKQIVKGDFEARVRQCIANLEGVLNAAGTSLDRVVKTTVFLTDMGKFGNLNQVYGQYWGDIKPARSCVAVARLPLDADVEIEAVAEL